MHRLKNNLALCVLYGLVISAVLVIANDPPGVGEFQPFNFVSALCDETDKNFDELLVHFEALAEEGGQGPAFPSTQVETRVARSQFTVDRLGIKIAVFSDDGADVWIKKSTDKDFTAVLERAFKPQHLPTLTNSDKQSVHLLKLELLPDKELLPRVTYDVIIKYTNIIHSGVATDVDGLSFCLFQGDSKRIDLITVDGPTPNPACVDDTIMAQFKQELAPSDFVRDHVKTVNTEIKQKITIKYSGGKGIVTGLSVKLVGQPPVLITATNNPLSNKFKVTGFGKENITIQQDIAGTYFDTFVESFSVEGHYISGSDRFNDKAIEVVTILSGKNNATGKNFEFIGAGSETLTIVGFDYTPKDGIIGSSITITSTPAGTGLFSNGTTCTLIGKYTNIEGDQSPELAVHYNSNNVQFDSNKPDEIKLVLGEVLPTLAELNDLSFRKLLVGNFAGEFSLNDNTTGLNCSILNATFNVKESASIGLIVDSKFKTVESFVIAPVEIFPDDVLQFALEEAHYDAQVLIPVNGRTITASSPPSIVCVIRVFASNGDQIGTDREITAFLHSSANNINTYRTGADGKKIYLVEPTNFQNAGSKIVVGVPESAVDVRITVKTDQ